MLTQIRSLKKLGATIAALVLSFGTLTLHAKEPLKIGYSDWPGWVAWEIGIQKGWFEEEG